MIWKSINGVATLVGADGEATGYEVRVTKRVPSTHRPICWAVVKGDQVVDGFNRFDDARREAQRRHGLAGWN